MGRIIMMFLLFTVGLSAQSTLQEDKVINLERFRLYDNNLLVIGDASFVRYTYLDEAFVAPLRAESIWVPLWGADQLEQHAFRNYPIAEGSVGRGVFTVDFTQREYYSGSTRLLRVVKIYETWYFHSGTSDPEYGYRLGMTPTEDNGGRHDTSEQDVINRAANLRLSSGQEIGVYRFTRITYDALMRNSDGRWVNVPGLDRITIHTPYELIHRY